METGVSALIEICDRALGDITPTVPAGQLRALLMVERAGTTSVNRLAERLGASPSATSRLCDRMRGADLLTRATAQHDRRAVELTLTESGRRLAVWVRQRRRDAVLAAGASMSDEGREALSRGLHELGVAELARDVTR